MSVIESNYEKYIFDNAKVGIAICNAKDNRLETVNPAFAAIHGYEPDELIGMPVENLFISKHMHLFQIKEKKFEVSMEHSAYETLHRKKDGSTFFVFVQIIAIKDKNGNIKQKILNITDISRYKKARQELKKHKLEYRALSENIPDAVVRYDMNIRRVYVNKEWERINGISSDEAIGKSPIELPGVISRQAKEFQEKLKHVVKHEKLYEWDFEFINLYGGVNCYSIRAIPEYDKLGKITGVLTTARDITKRKELEEEKINEQMHPYFESKLVGMAITSPQKEWLRVNQKLPSMLGYKYSELKSMTWEELTHPDDLKGEVEKYTRMLKGEIDEYIYEKRFIHKNGTIVFAKLLVSCVRNNDKGVDYVLTLIEDITGSVCSQDAQFDLNSTLEERIKNRTNELQRVHSKLDMEVAGRKHVQRQLTSREQLFTSVMENFPGFVSKYRLMPDGKEEFLYASKGIYDVYGVTLETALNNISALREMIHPEDIKSFRDAIEESARTLEVFDVEFRVLHREKGELWLKSRSTPQKQDDGSIVWHGITIDITKRKEAEKLLKQSEFEFHSLVENLPDNIARWDTEGRYLYINQTHERLLGMTLSEVIGTYIQESHIEVKTAIAKVVATKEKVTIRQEVPVKNGEQEIHDVSLAPEFNELGEVVSVLGIGRDVTIQKRIEIALQKSEFSLQEAQRIANVGSWDVDIVNNKLTWSDETYRIWEIDKELFEATFEAFLETVHPEDREKVYKTYNDSITNHSYYDVEHRLLFPDGRIKYIHERGEPHYDEAGKPIRFIGTSLDITERKHFENILSESEAKFREKSDLLEAVLESPHGIITFALDRNYCYLAFDSKHADVMHYLWGKEIAVGMNMLDVISSDDDREKAKKSFDRALGGDKFILEEAYGEENASRLYWQIFYAPIVSANGETIGLTCFNFDITERKKTDELLRKKEQEFRSLAENSPDVIVRYDCDLKRVYVNKAWEHVNSATRDDVIGKSLSERSWVISKMLSSYEQFLKSIIKTGETADIEFSIVDKNGKTIYFHQKGVPEFNSDGEVISILTVARNITEKKVLEDQLLEQNQFLDSLLNAIPVPIFYKDTETRYKGFNKAFEEFYGKKQEELIGKGVFDIFPLEQAQVFFDADAELFRHGGTQIYETKVRDIRGVDHDVIFHKSVYFDQEETVAGQIGTILDITERKLMEDALEKNRAFLAEAQRVSHTGSWELNFETNELSWSDEVYRIFEIDKNEFSASYEGFFQVIHPDDRDMVNDAFAKSLENQTVYEIEHRLLMSDGRIKHVLERGETKYSDDGKALSTLGIVHDVTERKRMQERLEKREEEFRSLAENAHDPIYRYDRECRRIYINPAVTKLTGKTSKELLGKKSTQARLVSMQDSIKVVDSVKKVLHTGKNHEVEILFTLPDGTQRYYLHNHIPEFGEDGKVDSVLAIGKDITVQKEIATREEMFRTLAENSPNIIMRYDKECNRIYANPAFEQQTGIPKEKLLNVKPDEQWDVYLDMLNMNALEYQNRIKKVLKSGESDSFSVEWIVLETGRYVAYNLNIVAERDKNGNIVAALAIGHNVTERNNIERRIEFMAHHDALTGLPNRILVKDRAEQALANSKRLDNKTAVLYIDLDEFKTVNDSLGHSAGDAMLKLVTSRLQKTIRASDTLSRQGGDEFLLLLPNISNISDVSMIADNLLQEFKTPFNVNNHVIPISASIGIAIYPEHGENFEQLLQSADAAMYRAKETGKNNYCLFTQQMKHNLIGLFQMQNDLKDAIKNQEFVLHYQPQIDLAQNKITGAEALIRWKHSKQGMISPMSFIPVAESTGLIVEIGAWVIMEACRQAALWNKEGKEIVVAVNISAVQFQRSNLENVVKNALKITGLDPKYLELELTESILIKDTENILQTVKVIKELGIQLSIDDFGTGYSSLAYLKRFAVDKLKIDQSFVRDILKDKEDASIVRTIIQMAKSFNLRSIAEGVENQEVLDVICEFGCDEVQGYHFAKPMEVAEFENYYKKVT